MSQHDAKQSTSHLITVLGIYEFMTLNSFSENI